MTEISEAAKRKARDLANSIQADYLFCPADFLRDVLEVKVLIALARVLQEHSDAAKACKRNVETVDRHLGPMPETLHMLQSLILPDEPCRHSATIKGGFGEVQLFANRSKIECEKCGAWLKLTEAGE